MGYPILTSAVISVILLSVASLFLEMQRSLPLEHMWLDKGKSKHKRVSLAAQKHGSMLVWNQSD